MLRFAARAAALFLTAALALTTTAPALADPPRQPAASDIVGVGAETTEMLFNRFSADYNASLATAGDTTSPRLYSWDSTGGNEITTKAGATPIVRPIRTDPGIDTLNANTSGTLDFARSSRGPRTYDPSADLFVAMAKDSVSWAAPAGGNAPANLTAADLREIFTCVKTNWRQIDPALPDAAIVPVLAGHLLVSRTGVAGLPSDSSDFFLGAIGYQSALMADPWTDHSCVRTVVRGDQGTDPVLHDPNAIVPYSVGRYIGQVHGGHTGPGDEAGALTVRSLDGIAPVYQSQMSLQFSSSAYARLLYNVVRAADWNSGDAHGRALRDLFSANGWICKSPVAVAAIKSHGFRSIPAGFCGSTAHN
ncbi:hypothetical protein [Kitasatospora sp. NPDC008115]|uniref:hypothetical protein n=1 Tax=Kitasatospora sp. NPDC008115 TaxID=3364022 RepID=UPI0036F1578F